MPTYTVHITDTDAASAFFHSGDLYLSISPAFILCCLPFPHFVCCSVYGFVFVFYFTAIPLTEL